MPQLISRLLTAIQSINKRIYKMSDIFTKLNSSFSPSKSSKKSGYRHEEEESIIQELRYVMKNSATASKLLDFVDSHRIEIHILKNKSGFGFVPESSHIYISATPDMRSGSAEMIIHLTAALREAQQEFEPELRRPSVSEPQASYQQKFVNKKSDIRWHQCAVVHELDENLSFTEIVDSFKAMGYSEILDGYRKDLQETA
jgi:hypothetical protein